MEEISTTYIYPTLAKLTYILHWPETEIKSSATSFETVQGASCSKLGYIIEI